MLVLEKRGWVREYTQRSRQQVGSRKGKVEWTGQMVVMRWRTGSIYMLLWVCSSSSIFQTESDLYDLEIVITEKRQPDNGDKAGKVINEQTEGYHLLTAT